MYWFENKPVQDFVELQAVDCSDASYIKSFILLTVQQSVEITDCFKVFWSVSRENPLQQIQSTLRVPHNWKERRIG